MTDEKTPQNNGSWVFWTFFYLLIFPVLWVAFPVVQKIKEGRFSVSVFSSDIYFSIIWLIMLMSFISGFFLYLKKKIAKPLGITTMVCTIISVFIIPTDYFNFFTYCLENIHSLSYCIRTGLSFWIVIPAICIYCFSILKYVDEDISE